LGGESTTVKGAEQRLGTASKKRVPLFGITTGEKYKRGSTTFSARLYGTVLKGGVYERKNKGYGGSGAGF